MEGRVTIEGKHKGPRVVILGSVHGNERVGAAVVQTLARELKPEDVFGTVELVVGNPRAYEKDIRFTGFDLNRLFGSAMPEGVSAGAYEVQRAVELKTCIEGADYLLDIHSTIKPSVPFVYMENTPEHRRLAALFGTPYIVSAEPEFRPRDLVSSTDTYVDAHGGVGLTYESGWHKDEAYDTVLDRTRRFLDELKVAPYYAPQLSKSPPALHLIIYGDIIPSSPQFSFAADYSNFDRVPAGSVIAHDGETAITAQEDSFIVFPKVDIGVGRVACYLARVAH